MTRQRLILAVVAVVAVAAAVVGWRTLGTEDPIDAYCAEVKEHREAIGEEMSAGGRNTGLINALPAFELLQEKAPDDIVDEWRIVVDSLHALVDAIEAAGADPATYDRDKPPADVTAEERKAIDDAAVALGRPKTKAAFAGVAQHSRDVCHTPLYL